MHVSTAQEVIFERIGRTMVEVTEEVASEPLPEPMVTLLKSHAHQRHETNVICALIGALAEPEHYRFVERDGELFLLPVDGSTQRHRCKVAALPALLHPIGTNREDHPLGF